MNILGLSGLHRSVDYKQKVLPDAETRYSRIAQGMDSAAALVIDGEIVAAVEEERLNRKKHSHLFPALAVDFCLQKAGLTLEQVDQIAYGFNYQPYENMYNLSPSGKGWYENVYSQKVIQSDIAQFLGKDAATKCTFVSHHLAHAASTFYPSGFEEALVIIADGMGEMEGVSIFRGHDQKLELLHQIPFSSSIGILYSLITFHLGFDFNADEYKTMGLAPYGDASKYLKQLESWCTWNDACGPVLKFIQPENDNRGRETYQNTLEFLSETFFPPRNPETEVEQHHKDLAAALQSFTNTFMTGLTQLWMEKTGSHKLCLAGGVALNCVANYHISKLNGLQDVFIQPAAGDDGTALGAALHLASSHHTIAKMGMPFWGPGTSTRDIKNIATQAKEVRVVEHGHLKDAAKACAKRLAEGKVLAIYQGDMEFGPRALGHRSILADPRVADMRDRVNAMVKMREAFRPFAPAVMAEHIDMCFDTEKQKNFPYMLFTLPVKEKYRTELPAITHVDGSARVQTVHAENNPFFHAILDEFYQLTGMPMLLNTSFNVKGQVIVHTARQAYDTFINTGINGLFMEHFEFSK